MNPKTLAKLLQKYGQIFADEIRRELARDNYTHARGYNLRAYSEGRKKEYRGKSYISRPGDTLYDSVKVDVDKQNNSVSVQMADYWRAVNFGIDPENTRQYLTPRPRGGGGHSAFIDTLKLWAQNKMGLNEEEALGAAFAIRRNIWKFGTEPREFYGAAVTNTINIISEEFTEDSAELIDSFINSITEILEQ